MKFWLSIAAIGVAGLSLAGCNSATVSAENPGYVALNSGDYAKARDIFKGQLERDPHDPFVQLDLGLAYQGLGQMNLAEPYYREALVDGRNVIPISTTNPADAGKDLATIACRNLKAGLGPDASC